MNYNDSILLFDGIPILELVQNYNESEHQPYILLSFNFVYCNRLIHFLTVVIIHNLSLFNWLLFFSKYQKCLRTKNFKKWYVKSGLYILRQLSFLLIKYNFYCNPLLKFNSNQNKLVMNAEWKTRASLKVIRPTSRTLLVETQYRRKSALGEVASFVGNRNLYCISTMIKTYYELGKFIQILMARKKFFYSQMHYILCFWVHWPDIEEVGNVEVTRHEAVLRG